MLDMNNVRKSTGSIFAVMPIFVSMIAVNNRSILLGILAVVVMYLAVVLLPCAKGHESVWIFCLSTFASIPLNVKVIGLLMRSSLLESDYMILQVMRYALIYVILFCVEEVLLGYVARIIWRRQKIVSF